MTISMRRLAAVLVLLIAALTITTASVQAAGATLSSSTVGFGNVHLDTTVTKTEKVTVAAGYAITSITGTQDPFAVTQGDNCTSPGPVSCELTLSVTPREPGTDKAQLAIQVCQLSGKFTCSTYVVSETATALEPGTASPSSVNYGNGVVSMDYHAKTFTITHDPGWTAPSYTPDGSEGGDFRISYGVDSRGCFSGVSADPCTFDVDWQPTVTGPTETRGSVLLCPPDQPTGQDPCVPIPVYLTGNGTPEATYTPTAVAFGSVSAGTTVVKTIAVKPHVWGRVDSVTIQSDANARFAVDSSACGVVRSTCNLQASFTPYQTGPLSGTATVKYCGQNGICELDPISLSGTGTDPGTVSPTSIAFPSTKVGASIAKPEKVTLDPGWYVQGATFSENGESTDFAADTSTCPTDGTCTFDTTFAPVAVGAHKATMLVTVCPTNPAPFQPCLDLSPVALSGTGTAPGTLSSSSLSFGSVPVYHSKTLGFTATLDHGWSLSTFTGNGTNAPYSVHQAAPCVRNANGTYLCKIAETYTPQNAAANTATTSVVICQDTSGLCVTLGPVKSSGTGTLTTTTTKLTSSATHVTDHQQVNLTAGVTPAPNLGPDPGTVTFYDGTRPIAGCYQVPLASDDFGRYFSYCSTTLPAGQHSVKAVYSGTPGYKTSTSTAITITSVHFL